MEKLRYALIGCGRISSNHIAAALDNHMEIVAICDIVESCMENLETKFGLEKLNVKYYTDYKEMLAKEELDLIAIATESGKHASIAIDCIKEHINVIIEKPIALSVEDADRIIEESDKRGVLVCACHQNRFNKSVAKVREAIGEERFGRMFYGVANVRWNRKEDYYKQAQWRGTWEQDGGALMNQCIHNIDLLRWMMGDEITEVVAYTENMNHPYIEAEDFGIALIKFAKGGYGIIEGTTNIYPDNFEETLCLFGEKGTIKIGGKSVNVIEEWRFGDDRDDEEEVKEKFKENPLNIYGFGHGSLYADVKKCIETGEKPYIDAYAGRRALELVLAIYQSTIEHRIIKLPLKQGSSVEFRYK